MELEKHNVSLEAVTETVDSSELGKLISYIRGFASKLEAEKIRERTMRGKAAYVKMGKLPIGTGKGLYGYRWDKEAKKRLPLEFEARVVDKIFSMLAEGLSCFNVARTLNDQGIPAKTGGKWHPRTIRNMAVNQSYIGVTYYGRTRGSGKSKLVKQPETSWAVLPDATPPIISWELFDKVQRIRQQDRELHRAKQKHEYLLRGHAFCGYCGSPLVGSFLNHRLRYYHCRGTYPTATRTKTCNARYIRADQLEDTVWAKAQEILQRPETILAELRRQQTEGQQAQVLGEPSLDKAVSRLRQRIRGYDLQERQLVKLFRHGEISEDAILDELSQLKKDRLTDNEQLEQYAKAKEHLATLCDAEVKLGEYCERVRRNLDGCRFADKRLALEALGIQVRATPESVDIKGVIPLDITVDQDSGKLLTTGRTSA